MERLSITLAAALDDFVADLQAQGRTVTARNYRLTLLPAVRHGPALVAQLDARACRELMRERAGALADSSLHTFWGTLRSFCRWCVDQHYLPANPTDGLPKPRQRRPPHRWKTADQLRAMFDTCDSDVDRLIILLCGGSGLRSAELLGLRWRDVDLERGTVRVLGKGKKWRELAPGGPAIAVLGRLRSADGRRDGDDDGGAYVLPFRTGDSLRVHVRAIAQRARVGPCTVHMLRHSFAIAFLEASGEDGMTLQALLGHANPLMTQYYVRDVRDAAAVRKQRAVDLAGRIFGDDV